MTLKCSWRKSKSTQYAESATRLVIVTFEVWAEHGILPRARYFNRGNAFASLQMIESSSRKPHCSVVQGAEIFSVVNFSKERNGRSPASVRGVAISKEHVKLIKGCFMFVSRRE